MDDETGAGPDRPLRVQLELYLDRRPIHGRLRTERRTVERFVGWLGFVDALKRVHETRASDEADTLDKEDSR
jgi:hypothetical protein